MERSSYPSDLSDERWTVIETVFSACKAKAGRPPKYAQREIWNAIFYQAHTGCEWRYLPHDLPPWEDVWEHFSRWRNNGLLKRVHDALREQVRIHQSVTGPVLSLLVSGRSDETVCKIGKEIRQYAAQIENANRGLRTMPPGIVCLVPSITFVEVSMPGTNLRLLDTVTHALNIGDIIRDPLVILDKDLQVLSANRSFYSTFHTTAEDTEAKMFANLGSGQWNIPELTVLLTELTHERLSLDDYEVSRDFPEIGRRVMVLKARKLHIPGNDLAVLVLAIEDVSAQRKRSHDVDISEMRYRRLFEAARDGILLLDIEHGKITDANPYMTELLGYPHSELVGKELWEIGLLKDQAASREAFQELKRSGSIRYEDLPLESQGKEKHEVEFVSNLYTEGDTTVIQCNIRDITDRKRLEAALARANRNDKKIASSLQRTMLFQPNEDAFSGLSVQTVYSTASDEALVGGDFWDTFAFDNGHVALVCGDVMGHGLSSAVFTTELKHSLRAYIREHEQPARVLHQMNEYLIQGSRMYAQGVNTEGNDNPVCLALAIIDRQTGEATLSVAAMEWPVLVRANGDTVVFKKSGPPLGIAIEPKYVFEQVDFQLEEGDTLVMTTDGVTEARRGNDFFGDDGLVRFAVQSCRGTLKEMGETILNSAIDYAGGTLRDDACLVMVRKK